MSTYFSTTSCDKVCQWLCGRSVVFPGTSVSSTNKTDRNDITEILLKVALNTIALTVTPLLIANMWYYGIPFLA